MNGYGAYVWSAYGLVFVTFMFQVVAVKIQKMRLLRKNESNESSA